MSRPVIFATALIACLAGCASPDALPSGTVAVPGYTPEEVSTMSSDEKVALYNENVESDGEQLVCRRERLVGTHFRRTACYTRAELEDMRRAAQDTLENRPGREGDPFRAVTNPPGRP